MKIQKRVVVIFLLGTLVSTALWCSDQLKSHQSPQTGSSPSSQNPLNVSPARKSDSPDGASKPGDSVAETVPAAPVLNLQLPKPDATLTESDIVLQNSPHDIKNLLSDTQKKKDSPISVSGAVFIEDEEKKIPDPNARIVDQVKGGEVNVKVKTK